MPLIPDDPIHSPEADSLHRADFARGLADLVAVAPTGSSFRLGVFGGWGEGKTSVLRLAERQLRGRGHACVWIAALAMKSIEEVTARLLEAVVRELGIEARELHAPRSRVSGPAGALDGGDLDRKCRLIDGMLGEALQTRFATRADRLLAVVLERLGDRKIVVFVDDVDRVKPELVPDLLLALREVLDLPNFFYVLALSPKVVERGLAGMHGGWEESSGFLEKIVELPTYLPQIDEEDIRQLLRRHVRELAGSVDASALEGLATLLPRNPRRIKLFLRHLASLEPQLSRFDPSEVPLGTLYLCQLLKLEFPAETRALANDPAALRAIEHSSAGTLARPRESGATESPAEARHAPEGEDGERFLTLCAALRERGVLASEYRLQDMVLLVERPPLLTWREMQELMQRYRGRGEEPDVEVLRAWIEPDGRIEPARAQALFTRSIDLRGRLLAAVDEAHTEDEARTALVEAVAATRLVQALLEELGVVREGYIDAKTWWRLFGHLHGWSTRREAGYNSAMRTQELALLHASVVDVPPELQGELLALLRRFAREGRRPASEEFLAEVAIIRERFEATVRDSLLHRFEQPNGVDALWNAGAASVEQAFAFDPASPFHATTGRTRLASIAGRSSTDAMVHRNFLGYFRMLTLGAFGADGTFPADACRTLLEDAPFTELVWRAALARPLHPRTLGALMEDREKLTTALRLRADLLPVPRWSGRTDDRLGES